MRSQISEIFKKRAAGLLFSAMTWGRWQLKKILRQKEHGLPSALVVSLTSYPLRYKSLSQTLKSILTQSVAPDRIVLWVAEDDYSHVPGNVLYLREHGLDIRKTNDLRSFKKIIPLLQSGYDGYVVTCDDDVYYPRRWLEELTEKAKYSSGKTIFFHRGHRIKVGSDNRPLPYSSWKHQILDNKESRLNFPTGMGGVLYPPQVFDSRVTDTSMFLTLCPDADDLWLYIMARINNATWQRTGTIANFRTWEGTQDVALWLSNMKDSKNDQQLDSLIEIFGF